MSAKPYTKAEAAIAKPVIHLLSKLNTWVYRVSGGRIGGTYGDGVPVLLLTTTGRKSGRSFTTPLTYLEDGERYVVAASRRGMDHHPLWYLNLVANPDVEVQLGSEVRVMRARTADDAERAALWPKLVAQNPDYGTYQARTTRIVPVVLLSER